MGTVPRMTVYLCDLVHTYLGAGTYMFPLNIGFLAAYARARFGDAVTIRLFKHPERLLAALKEGPPDLVGFAHYTWNADLNARIAARVKERSPRTAVVFGGPHINHYPAGRAAFFAEHPAVDFYVPFQGERPFAGLLQRYLDAGGSCEAMKTEPLAGVYFWRSDGVVAGPMLERIAEPDEIPSPYLSGILDEFFLYPLIPLIETNRGCPYRCTFCAQGLASHNRIDFFSVERVTAELAYIARRVTKTNILMLADSNFGIAERDIDIARAIARTGEETGYPRRCTTNWAKNQPKIFEFSRILSHANVIVSLQSLSPAVLRRIKRENIDTEVFRRIIERVNESGGTSGTEVILGLPGETRASHLDALRQLFDWNVGFIICYNGLILDGSEMRAEQKTGAFVCTTAYRLIDSSFGRYDGILSFETEEGIRSTDTMSEEDILFFRPVHWLVQFLWNYRFYYDLLKYLQGAGINPVDFIVDLVEKVPAQAPTAVRELFAAFSREAREEWFVSEEELRRAYGTPERFTALGEGSYGKLNGKYIFKVLVECRDAFETYLRGVACGYAGRFPVSEEAVGDLCAFLGASIIDLTRSPEQFLAKRTVTVRYDIPAWRAARYGRPLHEFGREAGRPIRLVLTDERAQSLRTLFSQYAHANVNVTLRKMSEFMPITDFFYEVAGG